MQLIFPAGFVYGVVQMNPLAMVRDLGLDDLETLAAVAEMKPKKYLVYLEFALDLPLPKSRWCRYSMSPIGSTLRPMDRKYRLLPDMVVPIFPNTQYSSEDRPPVRPTHNFPLSNCFHWIENFTEIRVRRRPNGEFFDDARAIGLEAEEHVAMLYTFSKHYRRPRDLPSSDDAASYPSEATSLGTGSQRSIPPDALLDPQVRQACSSLSISSRPIPSLESTPSGDSQVPSIPQSDDSSYGRATHRLAMESRSDSDSSGMSSETALNEQKVSIIDEISDLNLFGWDPDPTFPLLPLVDLWLELEEHISTDDIPSPVDWYKEEEQIVSIIMDGFARRSISASSIVQTARSLGSQDGEPVVSSSQPARPPNEMPERSDQRRWGPRALQKIGSGTRWVIRHTVNALYLGLRSSTDRARSSMS